MRAVRESPLELAIEINTQPDAVSCGPTCLQAVYRHFGDEIALDALIPEIPTLREGGTLAVNLANHALERGYRAVIYTYNLHVFDPVWFVGVVDLQERLRAQAEAKDDPKLWEATGAYLKFLERGGELRLEDLSPRLIARKLEEERPILTGLSATFLYRSAREAGHHELVDDDIRGRPTGHFVVLCGWNAGSLEVQVADPLEDADRLSWVGVDRLVNAILLGVITYDANLLMLEPA